MQIPDSYEDLFDQARRARANGQADLAIELYSRIVDRLSEVLTRLPSPGEQLQDYLITAADELQLVLDWEGDHTRACALCRRLAELDPHNRSFWQRRAAIEHVYAGEIEGGLAELRRLVEEEPDEFWHPLELASCLLDLGRLDEAEVYLAEAERRARDREEKGLACWTRSRLLRERGQYLEAAHAWEAACKHDRLFRQGAETIYRMFLEIGDYDNAMLYLNLEENPLLAGYYRGLLAHLQGDKVRAEKAWRRVVRYQPESFELGWEAWAMAQLRLGEKQTALEFLIEQARRGHNTEQCYLTTALAWAVLGNRDAAKVHLDVALRIRRQTFGPRALLPAEQWRDFEEMVTDEALKQELKGYFAAKKLSPKGSPASDIR
jgi:tetratricopeptide (TPR) repeat protein